MKDVAELLQVYQIQHQLTQREMANLLGVSQATYNNWINGQTAVNPLKYYYKIAQLCQIQTETLIPNFSNFRHLPNPPFEHDIPVNALVFCQKYLKNLEETVELLKNENGRILIELKGKNEMIERLQRN